MPRRVSHPIPQAQRDAYQQLRERWRGDPLLYVRQRFGVDDEPGHAPGLGDALLVPLAPQRLVVVLEHAHVLRVLHKTGFQLERVDARLHPLEAVLGLDKILVEQRHQFFRRA